MKVNTLSDLKKLLKLCRAEGVQAIKVDGLEIGLGALPVSASRPKHAPYDLNLPPEATAQIINNIPTDEMSDEELLFYSVQEAPASLS